jgi:hypothetical protein
LDAFDEVMGKNDVVALTWRANQTDGKSERIPGRVDFGAQSAA